MTEDVKNFNLKNAYLGKKGYTLFKSELSENGKGNSGRITYASIRA